MDVSAQLVLSPIMTKYDSDKGGKPPYHPRMMLVLLLYSYCIGGVFIAEDRGTMRNGRGLPSHRG